MKKYKIYLHRSDIHSSTYWIEINSRYWLELHNDKPSTYTDVIYDYEL